MSGKPIPEAVDLQALGGAAEYLSDRYGKHDGWVRAIRAAIKTLTAAQQQGQAVAGWVNGDAFVDAMFWTDDEPPHGWTPVYTAPLPSVEVDESVIARLKEAYDFGQFSDDFNQPLARLIRKDIRSLLRALTAAQQQGQAVAYIEHSADNSSTVHLTQAGMQLGPGRHACYTAPPPSVPEAVRLLREYRKAPKFSNDHDAIKRTVALEDEIDAFLAAALAQQPAAVDDAMKNCAMQFCETTVLPERTRSQHSGQ